MKAHVYLCGLKHSGKSTLAGELGRRLGVRSFDLDQMVLELANADDRAAREAGTAESANRAFSEAGPMRSVRDIYRHRGRAVFQALEQRAAAQLAATAGPLISALGGGTVENKPAVDALSERGNFVYLKEDVVTLYHRVMEGGLPPFLDSADPYGSFRALCERRERMYLELADSVISVAGLTIPEATALVEQYIKEFFNAGK
jgi:shikimate kinase